MKPMRVLAALVAALLLIPALGRAAHPGANGLLAFEGFDTDNADVYVIRPDGTGKTNLTNHPAQDVNAAWSPDGQSLAFASDRAGAHAVYTMDADGSDVTQVSFPVVSDGWPTWSPMGTQIAFARSLSSTEVGIFVMNADGTGVSQVTSGFVDLTPAWSSSGTEIAFSRFLPTGGAAIFAIRPDGTGLRQVTDAPGATDQAPNWSPDGSTLLFTRFGSSSGAGIYEVRSDGTGERQLVGPEALGIAVYSPDGARLAYVGPAGIFLARADGTDPTFLVAGQKPDWQPFGTTCSTGGLIGGGPTLLNTDKNELGPLSSAVHTEVEPLFDPVPPVGAAVHEVNCDVVLTVEGLASGG